MPPTPVHQLYEYVERTRSQLQGEGRGTVLLTVALGWFLVLSVRFLVPAVLPQITDTFRINDSAAGLAITIIWVGYALMQFPAGILVDRFGERLLLATSLGVGAASLTALSIAPVFATFLVGCALLGLATGLYGPARGTVLSNTFTENEGAAFGVTLAAGSIGSALLPFLGGVLATRYGWRATVGLAVPAFLVTAVVVWRAVPERPSSTEQPPSRQEVIRIARQSFDDRSVLVPVAAVTLMLFVFQGFTAFLPTYLIRAKDVSQSVAAALFALVFLTGAGFQLTTGSAADRYGERPVLVAVTIVGTLTLAVLPFVHGLVPLALLLGVAGVRIAITPITNAYIIDVLPDEVQGTAWGFLRTAFFLVAATGSSFVGVFSDAGLLDTALFVLAALTAAAAGLYAYLPNRHETGS